jgi:TPP-dependent pyruvate/acetoin dehydrogenase alpha subunit
VKAKDDPRALRPQMTLDLHAAYRTMILARRLDERMWRLARAGRARKPGSLPVVPSPQALGPRCLLTNCSV